MSSGYERVKAGRERRKAFVEGYKQALECEVCGEDSPSVLVFVGGNPETKKSWQTLPIGQLVNRNARWPELLTALKDSTVLCMNDYLKGKDDKQLRKVMMDSE